jgi:hypothetical protein
MTDKFCWIKKIMFKFLLLLSLISCSSKPTKLNISMNNVNKFDGILKEFNLSTKTPIILKDLPGKAVAACNKKSKNKIIYVNSKRWNDLSKVQKKLVLTHEIGHCDRFLKHDTRLRKDGCPVSIMYPTVFSDKCFLKYQKVYIKEIK